MASSAQRREVASLLRGQGMDRVMRVDILHAYANQTPHAGDQKLPFTNTLNV